MTIADLVAREQRRVRARLVAAGAATVAASVLGLATLAVLLLGGARWLALPRALPWIVWIVAAIVVGVLALRSRRTTRRGASTGHVAAAIEREGALRDGRVRGALEVSRTGPLGALAAQQVVHELAGRDLAPALRARTGRGALLALAGAALAVVALAASAAVSRDGFAALLHPTDAWRGTLVPRIAFAEMPAAVLRGERLRVQVHAPGRRHVRVVHRVTGHPWETREVALAADGRATVDVGPIDAELVIAATDGRTVSDTARVAIAERAFVGDVSVRADYPAYLGRAAEPLAAGETIRVPRGTRLTVSGRASTALTSVTLGSGAAAVSLPTSGHTFAGQMVAEASGQWAWRASGAAGAVADVPPPLTIDVVADSAPLVDITSPTADSLVDGLGTVHVGLVASDDHGLASVSLRVWRERADGGRAAPHEARLAGDVPVWSGEAAVDLGAQELAPGDKLHVQAVAVDGSPWRQGAASRELVLRVPSTTELRAQARAAADSAVARAAAAAQAQRELQQRTGDAARSRDPSRDAQGQAGSVEKAGDKAMSYQAAERAKGLAQEQKRLSNRVQSLQDQAKSLERQLKQAGALDSSLATQLADVQRLLKDALTPELQKQLQSLEQGASKLSGDQSRQALEQLAAQQRALRDQLEKSVEMLRRAAMEGAMQTLRDEAKDLAQAQAKKAQGGEPSPTPSSGEQGAKSSREPTTEELAQRSRDLTRDIESLAKRLKDQQASVGAEKAAEAAQHADASADAMERSARQERGAESHAPRPEPQPASGERPPQMGAQQGGQQGQQNGQQQGQQGGQPQGQQRGQGQQGQQGQPQSGGQQQGGQPQSGGQQRSGQQQGGRDGARSSQDAAREMQEAADQLGAARQGQIDAWKSELGGELDKAIQEVMQMAREQSDVEQQARSGADAGSVRSAQGAVQQGVDQTAQRIEQAGRTSSLLSQRAQRAVNDAKQQVAQATQALQNPSPSGQQGGERASQAMREAGDALNRAAAALVRDRERVNGASSASGFGDMIQQMRDLAKQQGQINSQASALPLPSAGQQGGAGRDAARQLARQQRSVADKLEALGDADPSGRSDALAQEARRLAQTLDREGIDPRTAERQQQLYRRLLDAGRTLEQDERDESGKREARSGGGINGVAPANGQTNGRAATRFQMPEWSELRGLSAEERRLVIEYFRRLNAGASTP